MDIDMSKYRFYTSKNEVIAVSTYEAKTVRGIAKCDPQDEFSLEDGKRLAAARCNAKVARKRLNRAKKKLREAEQDLDKVNSHYFAMDEYFNDSKIAYEKALKYTDKVLSSLS